MTKRTNRRTDKAPRPWQTKNQHKHFTKLYDDLIGSIAFKTLSPQAKNLYIELASRYKNNFSDEKFGVDCVVCPYSQLTHITLNTSSLRKYFKELEKHGFIDTKCGGLYRKCNVYHLSDRWQNYKGKNKNNIHSCTQ